KPMRPDSGHRHGDVFSRGDVHYSALKATIGSSFAAFDAGYQPLITPTAPDTNTDSTTYTGVTRNVTPKAAVRIVVSRAPRLTPIAPPANAISTASIRI